jgi:hypothetical protein
MYVYIIIKYMEIIIIDDIKLLIGKKVLFVDLETTGIPNRSDNGYPDYSDNEGYDNSRIIQIGQL